MVLSTRSTQFAEFLATRTEFVPPPAVTTTPTNKDKGKKKVPDSDEDMLDADTLEKKLDDMMEDDNDDDEEGEFEEEEVNWNGIILALMLEHALGDKSHWFPYFQILPRVLSTPLYWDEDDLFEIQGTAIEDKVGLEEIEEDYRNIIVPVIKANPDLFQSVPVEMYALDVYKWLGSVVMAYSFDDDGRVAMIPMVCYGSVVCGGVVDCCEGRHAQSQDGLQQRAVVL